MRVVNFSKGHGTLNDFVIVEDRQDLVHLSPEDVRFLCDRRGGIGADGVIRITRSSYIPEWDGEDMWFMDYRNADGSIAQTCGNGLRVFAKYVFDAGLASRARVEVGTRAGVRWVEALPHNWYRVTMGEVSVGGPVAVTLGDRSWPATVVDVGNPHAVVLLPDDVDLGSLDVGAQPSWEPASVFPEGTNVEFVRGLDAHHLSMRVHERGSGETMSCGTGTVAAAAVWAAGHEGDGTYTVSVRGGTLEVDLHDGRADLAGPAEIVASGHVHME